MRIRLQLLAVVLISTLVQALPVLAVNNLLGVYADSTGAIACTAETGAIACYVVVTDLSDAVGVDAWQFALSIDGAGFLFAPSLPAGSINLENFPRMRVGCAFPVAAAPVAVLLSFSAYAVGPASVYIERLSPIDPILLHVVDQDMLIQPQFAYGGSGLPVFSLGGAVCPTRNTSGGVVVVERTLWGDIKAQFRY